MALVGYEIERQRIEQRIAEIRSKLGGRTSAPVNSSDGSARTRKPLSAAARKRMASAQRKRWKAYHAQTGDPAPQKGTANRKLSPEAKAKLAANLAKARAAKAAKAKAA